MNCGSYVLVRDQARPADARLVEQSVEARLDESSTPLADRWRAYAQHLGDLLVVGTLGASEHDPGPLDQRGPGSAPARNAHEFGSLFFRQFQLSLRPSHSAHKSRYEAERKTARISVAHF